MDCIVHGVPKSQTRLSDFHPHEPFVNPNIELLRPLVKGHVGELEGNLPAPVKSPDDCSPGQ